MNLKKIYDRASALNKRILLPEGDDPRIREAACVIKEKSVADVTVISDKPLAGVDTRKSDGDPLLFGLELLASGEYDGLVAGAATTTAKVIRSALRLKELKSESLVSSFFLMQTDDPGVGEDGAIIFADCAVIPEPDEAALACIAAASAENARKILGWEPRVALLSFSTKGSAVHKSVDRVRGAVRELDKMKAGFHYDGELQLDSALIPEIAERKDPDGCLKGRANILIFPDLNSGNIGYKLAERLAGARAVGPILQGFKKPVNDLSRGCSSSDIVDVVAFTALQAS